MTETSQYVIARVESKRRLKAFLDDDLKIIVVIRDPVTRAVSDYVHKLIEVFHGSLPRNESFPITHEGDVLRESIKDTIIDVSTGRLGDGQQLVRFGQYITDLRGLMEVYSRDQLHILDGEAFIEDPLPSLQRVETFLGVPKFYKRDHFRANPQTGFYCAHVPERPFYHCANPKLKGRPHPTLDDDSEGKLRDYYRPFNLQLAKELDLDFPWLCQ
ncbi:heparan sulfate glucosamine 3-O-sulfotransferase 2-like [Strongylocentrotus purpuratus]|uniref:Sulfotransferase domain-containing protein n=1 Tax=Strongylocentrotus purpuratus TaxID=7668 RepID=A0A7M7P9K1_STRPU|nr:heparan sulfate glucosamine 3-O-sulfotransferase 2-like [Strongylocentrotus purpuratus]